MSHPIPIQMSAFLRRVLLADAIVSAVVGAAMLLGAGPLQAPLALPGSLLQLAGAALFPYAGYLVWLATRRAVPRAAVWAPIALNLVWAVECLFVAFGGAFGPSPLGLAFVLVQAGAVLAFAELEYVGLRRACAIVPA